jgi:hypothetical protein
MKRMEKGKKTNNSRLDSVLEMAALDMKKHT